MRFPTRSQRPRRRTLPEDWRTITAANVAHWAFLDDAERERLGELMAALVAGKRWESARGFDLTDEICTVIAAQASLLILGLDLDCYRGVQAVIVHPTTMRFARPRPGPAGTMTDSPFPILGQANHRGPVLIAWDAARAGARHPERGHDVVLHEFAHKLDMLDDLIDGTPPLPDGAARARWIEVFTREFELLRAADGGPTAGRRSRQERQAQSPLLHDYAATNPGEFFAVATEVFFDLPEALATDKAELYGVLRDFYRQDPAQRARRPPRR